MIQLSDVLPTGCTVERHNGISTVHAPNGDLIIIVCGGDAGNTRARYIAAMPAMLIAADRAIDMEMMLPIALGLKNMNSAVFTPPPELPRVPVG